MRILILTLPRTGSKFLLNNTVRWLQAQGLPVTQVEDQVRNRCYSGLDELLCVYGHYARGHLEATAVDQLVLADGPSTGTDFELPVEEFEHRIDLALTQTAWSAKLFLPVGEQHACLAPAMFRLLPRVDRILMVKRNLFDTVISEMIATRTGVFYPCAAQQTATQTLLTEPVSLDESLFKDKLIAFDWFYSVLMPRVQALYESKVQILDFDQLVHCTTSLEFADLLQLKGQSFELAPAELEYGDHKWSMITDCEQLRHFYASVYMPSSTRWNSRAAVVYPGKRSSGATV